MSERMTKEARRTQLLRIMSSLYEQAECREDFTVEKIAEAAGGISVVWVYKLVGAEFKKLRSEMEVPRHSPDDKVLKQNSEVSTLRKRRREMEAKFKAEMTGDFSAAIRHIEAQDEQIRSLKGYVRLLESRLAQAKQDRKEAPGDVSTSRELLNETKALEDGNDIYDLSDVVDATGNYSN